MGTLGATSQGRRSALHIRSVSNPSSRSMLGNARDTERYDGRPCSSRRHILVLTTQMGLVMSNVKMPAVLAATRCCVFDSGRFSGSRSRHFFLR